MSLIYKSSTRENLNDIQTYVVDTSNTSPKYFRVSDVPSVLQKGKNLLRITAHPTNLVPGSQIYVDVRDSNGDPIYYEIPDYLEDDKSRVISIWVYHDKGDDNTPNGEATITLVGIANVDLNGNPLPERHRGKLNVKWQINVNVDRDRGNTSEIVFNSTTLPSVVVSQSVEAYQNQSQTDSNTLSIDTQTGVGKYLFSGQTPVIQLTNGTEFNSEMVGGVIVLDNYTEPAYPQTSFPNATSDTYYSASIVELISPTAAKVSPKYVTTFTNLEGLVHTYQRVDEADYKITYYTTASNQTTENYRNFAVLTVSNVDPIAGVVDKVRILQKSDGISGEYELLNEVAVPYNQSFEIKVPIPSKNLRDPKLLKLLYINSNGGVSRTQTITEPYVFEGDNAYIGGSQNLVTGSLFVANAIDSGIEIAGVSSGFIRSVGFQGQTRAADSSGPGGFIIYSGSDNLIIGDDTLTGVGMQFVGDGDERHLIFSTANGGILDVKTDKFFIGNRDLQFISGSDGNIEISSSIFHLDPENNLLVIGADAVINAAVSVDELFTPATINGSPSNETNASSSIKSDGFARFVSASIGGFDVSDSQINSSNNNLVLKSNGQITGSDVVVRRTINDGGGSEVYTFFDTDEGYADFVNISRLVVNDNSEYVYESVDVPAYTGIPNAVWYFPIIRGEQKLIVSFNYLSNIARTGSPHDTTQATLNYRFILYRNLDSGSDKYGADYYSADWDQVDSDTLGSSIIITAPVSDNDAAYSGWISPGNGNNVELDIPSTLEGHYAKLEMQASHNIFTGNSMTSSVKHISVSTARNFAATFASPAQSPTGA